MGRGRRYSQDRGRGRGRVPAALAAHSGAGEALLARHSPSGQSTPSELSAELASGPGPVLEAPRPASSVLESQPKCGVAHLGAERMGSYVAVNKRSGVRANDVEHAGDLIRWGKRRCT